jgi:L-ascorbate metabolism protein UlaG (beta-lactamase superfamily)
MTLHRTALPLCALILTLGLVRGAFADPGKPVAVRWWGQGFVTIETWWGPVVAIDPYALGIGYDNPHVEADLVLVTHEHRDHNNVELVEGQPSVERALEGDGTPRRVNAVLDRYPNQTEARVSRAELRLARSPHAIYVESISAFHDEKQGAERGRTGMFLIRVDGVRILHCGDLGQSSLTDEQIERIGAVDVLLIPVGGVYTIDGARAAAITDRLSPRVVVPIHYKTDRLTIDLEPADSFLDALPERFERVNAVGNTLAIAAADASEGGPTTESPRVAVLGYEPWQMPAEMAALFEAKGAASEASQAVFRDLTVEQLNHEPSNGTHTARWNAEHMAGTELMVMTDIMHEVDPAMPVIRAMPQQMPPDYEAAHPDWGGVEQAAFMQRVHDFSRRFAYLLDGMSLDERPAGCPEFFGSLRGFLEKMAWHYGEHTAHVVKKFELGDWPAGER